MLFREVECTLMFNKIEQRFDVSRLTVKRHFAFEDLS